jgi:hypothetical protein
MAVNQGVSGSNPEKTNKLEKAMEAGLSPVKGIITYLISCRKKRKRKTFAALIRRETAYKKI